jgi:hypothetical protein
MSQQADLLALTSTLDEGVKVLVIARGRAVGSRGEGGFS